MPIILESCELTALYSPMSHLRYSSPVEARPKPYDGIACGIAIRVVALHNEIVEDFRSFWR